ncbi:MAG: methyltransferase, partial [Acidobacteria bacterium]|nr:methyltransferase [Acidobacteriota bacterium]
MMSRKVGAVVLVLVASVAVAAGAVWGVQEAARLDDGEIRAFLDGIHGKRGMMNVPRVDGEFLHDFIVERGYKRGLEIGTS